MPDLICPYSALIAQKRDFSCPDADEVIRRGGAEYICLKPENYDVCTELHDKVKQVYLQSEGLEDDLLSLPHSTYVKIQFGCVLGLQSALGRQEIKIDDVGALISDASKQFKNIDDLPFDIMNVRISTHKLDRRLKRNK